MGKKRREKLEAKGWKFGSAAEFLGLSKEEEAYIEARLLLSRMVRELRIEQNLTQKELAQLMRSSQSRVAKMEAGDTSISMDYMIKGFAAMGGTAVDLYKDGLVKEFLWAGA